MLQPHESPIIMPRHPGVAAMKVFISWSGDRSRQLAEALKWWLRAVIQRLEPWLSTEDLQKGTKWGGLLSAALETTDVGIVCVTRENCSSAWLLFEAGAL